MPRSSISLHLEEFTSKIIRQYQNRETIALIESESQAIIESLTTHSKLSLLSFDTYDHSVFFSELIRNMQSMMTIEKFLSSPDDIPKYEAILDRLIKILVHHYKNRDRFTPISANFKITLLEWIDGNPGSHTVKTILKPMFDAIHHSMAGDPIHAYERYKDIKLLGHKLGLEGKVSFSTQRDKIIEVDLEGYEVSYTFPGIILSIKSFLKEHEGLLEESEITLLNEAIEAIELGYQAKHHHLEEAFLGKLKERYDSGKPLVLTSGINRHSMCYILDNETIACINRGFQAEDQKYGSILYKIGNTSHVTTEFIRSIVIASNATREDHDIRIEFLKEGFKKSLSITDAAIHHHSAKKQKVGGCTWANIKEMFRTLLSILHKKTNPDLSWGEIDSAIKPIYKGFSKLDRTSSLKEFVEKYSIDGMLSDTEKGFLKLTLLQKHDAYKLDEVERAQFIIQRLGSKEILSFVEETGRRLSKMSRNFDFKKFVDFIEQCSHIHSREIKGTHELSDDLMRISSLYKKEVTFREPLEAEVDQQTPCGCQKHHDNEKNRKLKYSKSSHDLTEEVLSHKKAITFSAQQSECQKNHVNHSEKPMLKRTKSLVF